MSQENVNCVFSANRRKQFAECELELIAFGQDVIRTSTYDNIGSVHNSWFGGNGGSTPASNSGSGDDVYGQGA